MKKKGYIGIATVVALSLWTGTSFSAKAQSGQSATGSLRNQGQLSPSAHTLNTGMTRIVSQSINQTGQTPSAKINDRQMIVMLKNRQTKPFTLAGTTVVPQNGKLVFDGYEVLRVNDDQNYDEVLRKVQQAPEVKSANPNYIQHLSYTPTDSLIKQQWYLKKMNLYSAWNINKGNTNPVTIAVLDTGVDANNPELAGKVLQGYNFVDKNTDTFDNEGHGTAVAGLIAANANSGNMVGVDFNAKILPVKVADANGELQDSLIIQGIQYAIDHGAKIINMSFGGTNFDQAMSDELKKAHDAGIILVAAAGNSGTSAWEFPASDENVISVGAVDQTNYPSSFSNYGSWLDVTAPGQDVMSLGLNNSYIVGSGTSFAAPLISGTAALIASLHPTWTPQEVEWSIEASTQANTAHLWDPNFGYGVADAYQALKETLPSGISSVPSEAAKSIKLQSGTASTRAFILPNEKDWYQFTVNGKQPVTLQFSGGTSTMDLVGDLYKSSNGKVTKLVTIDNQPDGKGETYTFTPGPGTYDLVVYDYYGHWSSKPYSVTETVHAVPQPTASVKTGTFEKPFSVGLSAPSGDTIKYTLDGTDPTPTNGSTYTKPISLSKTTTIKAMTISPSTGTYSGISTFTYTFQKALFPDIAGYWAEPEITFLAQNKVITGYSNGLFGPTDKVTRAQTAKMVADQLKLASVKPNFQDVPSSLYAYGQIGALEKAGIIQGTSATTFSPDSNLTRAQAAAILVKAYHLTGTTSQTFKDVKKGYWAASAIDTLVAHHIVTGYSDQTFRPESKITRAEFSVMLAKVLNPSFDKRT